MSGPSPSDRRSTPAPSAAFGGTLRGWRSHRGLSQLDLALEAGVSPRHVSFLETGRSEPSREMVLRLAEALDVPLRERNRLFLAAGFAPPYSEASLDDERSEQVRQAVGLLLDRHDPYPGFAIDGAWEVVAANRGHRALLERLLPEAGEEAGNVLRLLFSPRLLRPLVEDWEACAGAVLARVRRQLDRPVVSPRLAAVVSEIRGYPDVEALWKRPLDPTGFDLFIPVALRVGETTTRWLSTLLTFAGAVDVTLSELTVECFFPADEATRRLAEGWGVGRG